MYATRSMPALFLAALGVFLAAPAWADVFVVNADGSGDYPTIPAALAAAHTGDEVLVTAGTYTWTNQGASGASMLDLPAGVVLRGADGPDATVLDAETQGRVLLASQTWDGTRVEGFTLTNGHATGVEDDGSGGGVKVVGGPVEVRDCRVVDCRAEKDGGGIYLEATTALVEETVILECSAGRYGGGVGIQLGAPTLRSCSAISNEGWDRGGGVYSAGASTRIEASEIVMNRSRSVAIENGGGGVYVSSRDAETHTVLVDCSIGRNTSPRGGGVMSVATSDAGSTLEITRCRIYRNDAPAGGGLLCLDASSPSVTQCTFVGNRSRSGTSVRAALDASPELTHCIFAFEEPVSGYPTSPFDCGDGIHGTILVSCSLLFENGPEDPFDCATSGGHNFGADPLFCDVDADDYALRENSPCLPEYQPLDGCDTLIGAMDAECAPDLPVTVLVRRDGTGDTTSIRVAMTMVEAQDTVRVGPSTYTWTSENAGNAQSMIVITPGIVFESEVGPEVTIIDAENQGRCFFSEGVDSSTVVDGLTFARGYANDTNGVGGGIYCRNTYVTFRNVRVVDSSAITDGGGVYVRSSTVHLEDAEISGNHARHGGGFAHYGGKSTLLRCAIDYNVADERGGGIYLADVSTTIDSCGIAGNDAQSGGGLHARSTFSGTDVRGDLRYSTIRDNTAETGGGLFFEGLGWNGRFDMSGLLVWGNTATDAGGGMWSRAATNTLATSTFHANGADVAASHLWVGAESAVFVPACIFTGGGPTSPIVCDAANDVSLLCCDIYDNAGDVIGCADATDSFSADPLYVNAGAGDFRLLDGSPCLPFNHPDGASCGVIGAFGAAGPVPVVLDAFRARAVAGAILVEWRTLAAWRHAGFNVYRSSETDGERRLNAELITGDDSFIYTDRAIVDGASYDYRLGAVDLGGNESFFGPVSATAIVIHALAGRPRPNPSSSLAGIPIHMPGRDVARLDIFDAGGRLVRTLHDGILPAGPQEISWDGTDDGGRRVAPGVYFYRFSVPGGSVSSRLVRY